MNIQYQVTPLDNRFRALKLFNCTHKITFIDTFTESRRTGNQLDENRMRWHLVNIKLVEWLGTMFFCHSASSSWSIGYSKNKKWSYTKSHSDPYMNLAIYIKDLAEFEEIMTVVKLTGEMNMSVVG